MIFKRGAAFQIQYVNVKPREHMPSDLLYVVSSQAERVGYNIKYRG